MFKPPIYVVSSFKQHHALKIKENDSKILRPSTATKKALFKTGRENFNQYMSTTTLHGLRYVGDKSLSSVER